MIGIYKITNQINGKMYVGQSINIEQRWKKHCRVVSNDSNSPMKNYPLYQAMLKYGINNFSFEILEQCDISELNQKEQEWIAKLRTYINYPDSNGYNLTIGGDGTRKITLEEINNIYKKWNEGLTVTEIAQQFSRDCGTVSTILDNICTHEQRVMRGTIRASEKKNKTIYQYNCYGQLINKYNSLIEAAKATNICSQNLRRVVAGQIVSFKDNIFLYEKDATTQNIAERLERMAHKAIIQINPVTNTIINIFSNNKEAAHELEIQMNKKINPASITLCANGTYKTSYTYSWKYLYIYLQENNFDYSKINNYLK